MHLTPPAVSLQIKEIESQVGQRLFGRTHRRIPLSTAGECFLVYARRLPGTLKGPAITACLMASSLGTQQQHWQ